MRAFVTVVAALLASYSAMADTPAARCATPDQKQVIKKFYLDRPASPPVMAARDLKWPEEVITAGMPPELSVGTTGDNFEKIWASLETWPATAMFIMVHDGAVFKFPSLVPKHVTHNRKDDFFDVDPAAPMAGLDGHLLPKRTTSIYAIESAGRGGVTRAILFYDHEQYSVFGVFAGVANEMPLDNVAAFEKTRELIRSLPRACP